MTLSPRIIFANVLSMMAAGMGLRGIMDLIHPWLGYPVMIALGVAGSLLAWRNLKKAERAYEESKKTSSEARARLLAKHPELADILRVHDPN